MSERVCERVGVGRNNETDGGTEGGREGRFSEVWLVHLLVYNLPHPPAVGPNGAPSTLWPC